MSQKKSSPSPKASKNRPAPKKSGGGLGIIILLLVGGGVAASNFAGPKAGWITKLVQGDPQAVVVKPVEPAPEAKPDPVEIKPEVKPEVKPEPEPIEIKPAEPVKSEAELLYEQYLAEELAKLPTPPFGQRVSISVIDAQSGLYREQFAVVTKVDDYKLYYDVMEIPGSSGRIRNGGIHVKALAPVTIRTFFTQREAAALARKRLQQNLSAKIAAKRAQETAQIAAANPVKTAAGTTATPVASAAGYTPTFDKFLLEGDVSAKRLEHPVLEFENWAMAQEQRSHSELFDKAHAKQQGSAAVLYVAVSSQFMSKSDDERYQIIDGIRQFWSLRCMSNGVAEDDQAFLCVHHQGRIVGGSKVNSKMKVADEVFCNR